MSKPDDGKPLHQRKRFTHEGVSFERLTGFHEEGRYSVVDQDGGRWTVTGDGTNRYPWVVHNHREKVQKFARNLVETAEWIARERAKNPLSPYKPEPRQ